MRLQRVFGIVIVCILTLNGSPVSLQADDKGLCVGVKVGAIFSDMDAALSVDRLTLSHDDDTDTRGDVCGGLFATLALNEWFALQPELLYAAKGIDKSERSDGAPISIKLHYIELPVLAKLTIPTHTMLTPSLFVGPALAFNVGAKVKPNDIYSVDVSDLVKTVDFGWTFGGGLDFDLAGLRLTLDARYTLGLTDISDIPAELKARFPRSDVDFKNRSIALMVGLGF